MFYLQLLKSSRMFYPKADIDYPDENLSKSNDELKKLYIQSVNFGKNVLIGKNVKIGKNSHIG